MILHFIDTSAFLKLFIAEGGSDRMLRFAAAENDRAKVVSALLPVEARSAICRLRDGRRMTHQVALSALAAVAEELQHLTVQPLTPSVLKAAAVLAERYSLRALDSLQLGSALGARELFDAPQMRFIASDRELLKAAEAEGFIIWNPESAA